MGVVVTFCDNAEVCPVWPSSPVKVHWSIPDRAAGVSDWIAQEQALERAWQTAKNTISELVKVIEEEPDTAVLTQRLNSISLDTY